MAKLEREVLMPVNPIKSMIFSFELGGARFPALAEVLQRSFEIPADIFCSAREGQARFNLTTKLLPS
jgi:hypothetical protein